MLVRQTQIIFILKIPKFLPKNIFQKVPKIKKLIFLILETNII